MILFVDEEYARLDPWISSLASHGFQCRPVPSAEEALDTIREMNVEAAVVDIMLPAGGFDLKETVGGIYTGIVLIKKIRELGHAFPIVALSIRTDCVEALGELNVPCINKALDQPLDLVKALRRLNVHSQKE